MFPFKKIFPSPKERTLLKDGKLMMNAKLFIILHHTGTKEGTINGVLDGLYRRPDYASCHFVVDTNGDAYKIGSPDDVLWHCGVSSWGKNKDMNPVSIGIEVIGPLSNGSFTDDQRRTVRALIQHLMAVFRIPGSNVLRHADITHAGSQKMELWDGKSPSRKVDIAPTFWKINRDTWAQYQQSLIPKEV